MIHGRISLPPLKEGGYATDTLRYVPLRLVVTQEILRHVSKATDAMLCQVITNLSEHISSSTGWRVGMHNVAQKME